jgi:heptosyltransferase-1
VRVVLTRLSALGDIVHTWPLADALTRGGEPVELAWVVEEAFLPMVALHPGVVRAVPVATRRWRRAPFAASTRKEVVEARRLLREFEPEVALDPQGLCKSAAWGWLSGAPERVGLARTLRRETFSGVCYTRTMAPSPDVRHVIDINLSLAGALGRTASYGASPDGTFLLRWVRPEEGRAAVALLPGTGGRGKAWPAVSFAALARQVADRGLPVTLVWGPNERALAESIVARAGPGVTLAPPTSLLELAALLGRCAAVVGGDTGPVHLAASLGVPTVAVFVATDPERNGPRGRHVRVVAAARTGARGGRARSAALGEASVADVLDALTEALGDGGHRSPQP